MIVCLVLAVLGVLSLGIQAWQYLAACLFPLHRRAQSTHRPGPVTLLKPLKGCDSHTLRNLQSWLDQEYPAPVQVLFGVRDPSDPVCALVRELMASRPGIQARLVICSELLGANAKVSSLAHLEKFIEGDWVVVSDADVWVPSDMLLNLSALHAQPGVGLVNCFYRLANPASVAMRWEAVAINADFWSQVLQSRSLQPQDFALGAVMSLRSEVLSQIGGFKALVNHLADDYHLGNRVARLGLRVELCPLVAECWESPSGWAHVWTHQLRWARTIRVCQPMPYFASIVSNLTLWMLALALALLCVPLPVGWPTAGFGLVGLGLAWRSLAALDLQRRLNRGGWGPAYFWMPWLKDLLGALIWFAAFVGTTVEWRGIRYRVGRDGKLTPLPA